MITAFKPIIILLIAFFNCYSFKNCNTVIVYVLPFENDYYVSISAEKIKGHSDTHKTIITNKSFVKELNSFLTSIDSSTSLKEWHSIDVRLLVEWSCSDHETKSIAFNRSGMFLVDGKVYSSNDRVSKIILEYLKIKLPSVSGNK